MTPYTGFTEVESKVNSFQLSTPTASQVVILVVVIAVVGLVLFLAARRTAGSGKRRARSSVGVGWHNFNQLAKIRGLSRDEAALLRQLVISYKLTKPSLIFTSVNILDSCIQRQIRKYMAWRGNNDKVI